MSRSSVDLPDGLSAASLGRILEQFDWQRDGEQSDRFAIWSSRTGDEILVPLSDQRADYPRLLGQAWTAVLSRYGSAARETLNQMTVLARGLLDTTQWKKETNLAAGLITWKQGAELFDSAQMTLMAAAKTTRENRLYHGNASSHIAKRFIEASLMGQTEIGSFIITAHTPSAERFYLTQRSESLAAVDPQHAYAVTGRQILDTLVIALSAVEEALPAQRKTPEIDAMLDLQRSGVSHELLTALAHVTSSVESAVEVERAETSGRTRRVEFAFDPVDSPILERAARRFAASSLKPEIETVSGEVTLLSRGSSEPHRVIRIDSGNRKVRVRLSAEDYDLALEAHSKEALLQVRGKVEREKKVSWIYNPERLVVVETAPQREDDSNPLDLS